MSNTRDGVLVWSRLTRRSRDIARTLGITLYHIGDRPPYLRAWRETARLFSSLGKDACIILQLPPGPAVYRATKIYPRPKLICDTHTGMFHYRDLKDYMLNRPFIGSLKKCDHVLVHNPESRELLLQKLGGDTAVHIVYDPLPHKYNTVKPRDTPEEDFIVLPVAWEADENIKVAVEAFIRLVSQNQGSNVSMVITGNYMKNKRLYKELTRLIEKHGLADRILFTGYIGYGEYLWYIENSVLTIALTNWEYTILSVVWEAALFDKPILYPSTRTLVNLLGDVDQGFLKYSVDDSISLAEALKRTLNNREHVSDIGRAMGRKLRNLSQQSMKHLSSLCRQ
ncbi:MAG: glycosyltransferase [Desulfurococcales archaeon]|nr:glycosyltransferase [Desulfurococcales archaeon]